MELLKKLYEIHSPSGQEKRIKRFIRKYVIENIEGANIVDNRDGNIYIVKGDAETYPCVVAHLDQVQRNHSEDFVAVETEHIVFGYSPKNKCREGLGADDKNGLWIALKCLEYADAIKVAFFVGEEIGCIGSGKCDMTFFKDCRFVVQPDRKGGSDLITNISGKICSAEFERDINADFFGYKATSGLMTDVLELSERGVGLSCINLSCGYYDPHSDDEFTVIADLLNCLCFVKYIIDNCTKVYEHKYASSYSYGRIYDDYYDWDYKDDYRYSGYSISSQSSSYCGKYPKKDYNSIKVLRSNDYADLESFVDQLMYENVGYEPEEIWPYVSSDLETYGITEDQFMNIAYSVWWDYNEQYYDQYYR